jgi:acyl carrier protein
VNASETEIFEFLKNLMLTFLDVEPESITPETELAGLGLDSLDFIEAQVELQKTFGIKIDVSALPERAVKTVGGLVSYASECRAAITTLEAARVVAGQ